MRVRTRQGIGEERHTHTAKNQKRQTRVPASTHILSVSSICASFSQCDYDVIDTGERLAVDIVNLSVLVRTGTEHVMLTGSGRRDHLGGKVSKSVLDLSTRTYVRFSRNGEKL